MDRRTIEELLVKQAHTIYSEELLLAKGYDAGKMGTHVEIRKHGILGTFVLTYAQTYDSPEGDIWEASLYRAIPKDGGYGLKDELEHVHTLTSNGRFYSSNLMLDMIKEFLEKVEK